MSQNKLQTVVFYPDGSEKVASKVTNNSSENNEKNQSVNYFKWLVNSWIHPGTKCQGAKWFGITTIIAELLVFFGSLYAFFHKVLANTMFDIDNIFYTLNGSKSNIAELLVYSKLFGYSLIAAAIILGGTYLVNRYLVSGEKESFWDYMNRVAQYCGLNVIFALVILILGLIGTGGRVISILTIFSLFIFGIAILIAVVGHSNEEGLDKVYAGIVTGLIIGLGYFVFYILASQILLRILSIGMSVLMQMMFSGQ
ncbi:DUF6574 domain-containing protein [Ligilactobacillus cholophilus]|uniref:DUF6574 domain-containing protein n=1 Tax=Ligilactobacillus cholophilus TaxID=3050131 RepID=UPI0025AFDF58|nr:DUF6574 domain-containing protein [Ligilactobacillus cholophilus]